MTMATEGDTFERRASPMNRDLRLSPRCIVTHSSNANAGNFNNDLSMSPIPNGNPSENTNIDKSRSNIARHSEGYVSHKADHCRQGSGLSITSNEISQYLCPNQSKKQHSRPPSLLDSPLSVTSWSFHSRQSSFEGINMRRKTSWRKVMTPSPLNRPPPPPYGQDEFGNQSLPEQVSPTSLDLGYHTLLNNNSGYDGISNGRHGKDIHSPVLDKRSNNSSTPNPPVSGRSNSNLAKSSIRKEFSLLPTKTPMIQSLRNADNVIRDRLNGTSHDSETVHMNHTNQTVIYKGSQNKNNKKPNIASFDQLSNKLIVKILSHLCIIDICVCAKVCRRFYFLAWEPSLWKALELDCQRFTYLNADYALHSLLNVLSRDPVSPLSKGQNDPFRQASLVENVIINSCSTLSDIGLLSISNRCPELRRLELNNCKEITNAGIQAIATSCTSLDHLELTGCPMISTINFEVPEPTPATAALGGVPPAPSRSLYLRYLDLTDCTRLMDAGLQVIVRNAPHLQQLYLRRCVNITDIGVKYIASYCLGLRELSLSDCTQVTDFGLYELAKLGPNLRYLSVAKCDQISDSGIQQMARLCYKLRYLNVRGCESISDNALNILARSCMRLKSLDIGKCDVTDLGLKLLGEFSTSLRKLSVKSCEMITDEGIKYIAYHCKGLQHINIQDCPITVEGYRTLKKFCKKCIIEHTNPGFY